MRHSRGTNAGMSRCSSLISSDAHSMLGKIVPGVVQQQNVGEAGNLINCNQVLMLRAKYYSNWSTFVETAVK